MPQVGVGPTGCAGGLGRIALDAESRTPSFGLSFEYILATRTDDVAMVVVFLPFAFVTVIIGEYFRPFAISVCIANIVSLVVAMMLIPVLGAKFSIK